MLSVAIQIDAQDASGAALPLRLVSHDVPELGHYDGQQWEPALAELPSFALDFFGGGFQGQVTAPTTGFAAATIGLAAFSASASARARFADARVRVWVGTFPATGMVLRFDGRMTGEPEVDDATRIARFTAAVNDSWADDPLLDLFAGTGGIEGPADLTGQPKPLVLGNARFCGGVIIDSVDNVWMVSNGAIQAVNAVFDRLASLGASAGDHADLAALLAATIPNGSWATCLAQGLVRLGAPPDGRVSFHVSGSNSGTGGYVRRAGAIIRRIAELAGGTVNAASLTALDAARPYNLGLQLREQVTPRDIIAQIADSVGAVAGVSLTGELFAQALSIGSSGEALNADGTSPLRVAAVEELAKSAPNWRLATEAELTFEVHSADEAAFSYRWQGEYSATRVYRLDDVVTGPDSAAWAYINATPAAGEALPVWPTASNAHWRLFQAPGAAGVAPGNANRVPFSRMEGDRGWQLLFNPVPLVAPVDFSAAFGLRFVRASAVATAAGQSLSIGQSGPAFPVRPGERLSVQARVELSGTSGGTWQLELWTFEADGVTQSPIVVASGAGPNSISTNIVSAFVDVPAGRVFGRLELRAVSAAAGTMPLLIAEPMVTSAAAGQTVHPPFSPGPNASDGADPNNLITIGPDGEIDGIGPGNGTPVDNGNVVLEGVESARPGGGLFIGQLYSATDTGEVTRWNGTSWEPSSDITTTAVRIIEPQFPVIEIKQGEAGNVGNRTVTHIAKRGTATLTGGTWSITSTNVPGSTISINASTGTVTLSGVAISGAYMVRYTHTDGIATDLPVNVTYLPTPGGGTLTQLKTGFVTSNAGTANNNNWQQIASLTLQGAQAGTASLDSFNGSSLDVSGATGTADFEARLLINGTEVVLVDSQNVVTGGVLSFADFSGLFIDAQPTPAGNVTFIIQLRRTSGSGVITSTTTRLEATIFAS
jgi:hypothetical protein